MLDQESLNRMLTDFPALAAAPGRVLDQIRDSGRPLRLANGASLFSDGDACSGFVVVSEGAVRVSKLTEDGRELLLYYVRPRELCVLTVGCLLGGGTYPARGLAEGAFTGLAFDRPLFETLVMEVPEFRRQVFGLLSDRLMKMMMLVEEVAFHRLDRRLARHLLQVRELVGKNALALTHQQIAEDLGTAREIVSRLLESLASQGIVALARGRVEVRDVDALRGVVDEGIGPSSP